MLSKITFDKFAPLQRGEGCDGAAIRVDGQDVGRIERQISFPSTDGRTTREQPRGIVVGYKVIVNNHPLSRKLDVFDGDETETEFKTIYEARKAIIAALGTADVD